MNRPHSVKIQLVGNCLSLRKVLTTASISGRAHARPGGAPKGGVRVIWSRQRLRYRLLFVCQPRRCCQMTHVVFSDGIFLCLLSHYSRQLLVLVLADCYCHCYYKIKINYCSLSDGLNPARYTMMFRKVPLCFCLSLPQRHYVTAA